MTQIRQDNDGDILFENNVFSVTENLSDEEIVQSLKQNLKTFLGEWFLDLSIGLPYIQIIFVKGTPAEVIDAALKNAIIKTEGVETLNSFDDLDLDSSTRELNVNFDVTTINGNTININGV